MSFSHPHLFTSSHDETVLSHPKSCYQYGYMNQFHKERNESHYSKSYLCGHGNLQEFFSIGFGASFNQSDWVLCELPTWLHKLLYLVHGFEGWWFEKADPSYSLWRTMALPETYIHQDNTILALLKLGNAEESVVCWGKPPGSHRQVWRS